MRNSDRTLAAICGSWVLWFQGCSYPFETSNYGSGDVGGYEDVVLDLPFAEGYQAFCTQGANGSYSHQSSSTQEDIDLDTPNGQNDLVYAPIGGVARVHMESANKNFGYHINIDLGNGTYVVIAHFSDIFIEDGAEVAAGQILGFEGCTGSCSGDHVHVGLHSGEATSMAEFGKSQSVSYYLDDVTSGLEGETITSEEFVCGEGSGHIYGSRLPVGTWHPNGSLVKTPDSPLVYLIENGTRRWIETEDIFWSLGYDFRDVALISDMELNCYDVGSTIVSSSDIETMGDDGDGYPEGTLLKEESTSDVYVVSDGTAMPIESYDVFLKLGWGSRQIMTVEDGMVGETQGRVGSCSAGYECIDQAQIETCATGEAVDMGEGGADDGGTEETDDDDDDDDDENNDPWSMLEGEIDDGEFGLVFIPPNEAVEEAELVGRDAGTLLEDHDDGVLVYTSASFEPGAVFDFAIRYSDGMSDNYACEFDGDAVIERGTIYAVYGETVLSVESTTEAYNSRACYHRVAVPDAEIDEPEEDTGETVTDSEVEICYAPGVTMAGGELYLDGGFFTNWDSDPADTASFGDTQMCATVQAVSGEEVKMNAWFMESSTVEWAAYNNWCFSIDWQGTLTVDGTTVLVETRPWSEASWASDPCNTGGDAFFNVL